MGKTKIVTDSTAFIPDDILKKYDISVASLKVNFGAELSFAESSELPSRLFYDLLYERIKTSGILPSTSQPSIGEFVEIYRSACESYDSIVSIHLSSEISGTYSAARMAAEMVQPADITVIDSRISSIVQAFAVLEAARAAHEGAERDEVISVANRMLTSTRALFMVDDLSHLQRGGRISGAQAFIGSLLQVRPILHFIDGKIHLKEKVRTRDRAIKKLLSVVDSLPNSQGRLTVGIVHADNPSAAEQLAELVRESYPEAELMIVEFSPVIATHLGPGSLGLGAYRL